jgi:hypothetical protein
MKHAVKGSGKEFMGGANQSRNEAGEGPIRHGGIAGRGTNADGRHEDAE